MHADIDRLVNLYEHRSLTRRQLVVQLGALLGAGRVLAAAEPQGPSATFKATEINHIALRVTDVDRSRAFYERHLGLSLRSDGSPGSVFLNCGRDFVALFRAEVPAMDHYCYTVEGYDPADAVKRLTEAGLSPRRSGDRVYFDDPDGLEVQVSAPNR